MLTARMIALAFYMLIAGLVGGLANYLNTQPKEKDPLPQRHRMKTSLLLGVVASFITPLFLSLTKSDLFNNLVDKSNPNEFFDSNVFVFFGFCLVASFSSRIFLDSLTKKVMDLSKDVDALEDKTDAIDEQQKELAENTTLDPKPESSEISAEAQESSISPSEYRILSQFIVSKYTWRSMSAVAREAQTPKVLALRKARSLVEAGLLSSRPSTNGDAEVFKITAEGRKAVAEYVTSTADLKPGTDPGSKD